MGVEIIGRACVAPGANSPRELFDLLRAGRTTVSEIPNDRWDKARYWHPKVAVPGKSYTFAAGVVPDIMGFDPSVFGMSPREAESLDPQQRLTLRVVWRALEDANLAPSRLVTERVGVYIGASSLEYGNLIVGDPAAASPYFMTGNTLSVLANRVSHLLNVSGPSLTIDTACSSGLAALDLAVRALESGEVDTAIVGSVNALFHPGSFVGFAQARMLSPAGQCRAYDDAGEGYVRAEGGVALVLRRSDRAAAAGDRSHASIVATGVNSAGRTNGISLPSGEAQASLLHTIYSTGEIDPNRLAFIEGHGTGTKVGDPSEVWSIGTEIGWKRSVPIPIGSIKTNIGHTEPASGLMGLMKAMLALEHDYLPASLHFDTPNKNIDFVGMNVSVAADGIQMLRGRNPRLAGINSFGFGGTNAHVVISDPPKTDAGTDNENGESALFFVSSQTASALTTLLQTYRNDIETSSSARKAALISAAGPNRPHLRCRFAIPSLRPKDVVEEIDAYVAGRRTRLAEAGEAVKDQAGTAFVFSGNGSQWAGMAADAFQNNRFFQDRFKVVDALFHNESGVGLTDLLFDEQLEARLADTRIAQPLLFASQVALADSLVDLGVRPTLAYGHSIGEVAAAYCSGALSLVDAVTIVSRRSNHQHAVAGMGTMAAVVLKAGEALDLARAHGLDRLELAAENAPRSVTLSGPGEEIAEFLRIAASERIVARALDIDYPFHHTFIDVAERDFLKNLPNFVGRVGEIPFISTVTGETHAGTALDAHYWWRNIREPVQFAAATGAAIAAGVTVFVEIGPRPILSSYLRELLNHHGIRGSVISTLSRPGLKADVDPVARSLARAAAAGAQFDTAKVLGARDAAVDLPPLPFENVTRGYAVTPEALDIYGTHRRNGQSLLGWSTDPFGNAWRNHIDAHLFPDLAQHVVENRAILPGSAFLEIVVQAGRCHFGEAPFEIANLEILHPIHLSSERILTLSTVLSPETGQVQVRTRERLQDDAWTLHAVARIRQGTSTAEPPEPSSHEAREIVAADDVYRTTRRFGLDYGPCFRLLEQIHVFEDDLLDVELAPAADPANPFVNYDLDPVSTDAAFHGLVGLLDRLAPNVSGAPYVPVHFGVVRLHRPGVPIRRARIKIEHASKYSIKAEIWLFDETSRPVATLLDCRFRRVSLKPHKQLDALTYHYERVPSPLSVGHGARSPEREPALADPLPKPQSEASLLLGAAAYRACYDVALARQGRADVLRQAGSSSLDSFVTNCLYRLEEAGLARLEASGWTMDDCPLPPFAELLNQFLVEEPGRSLEAILLGDAYKIAMERLGAADEEERREQGEAGGARRELSAATCAHYLTHAPSVLARQARLAELVDTTLTAASDGSHPPHVVELRAVSRAFSQRLAEATANRGGRLTIIEPGDRLRNELQLSLGEMAHLRIVEHYDPDEVDSADLVVSASDDFHDFLETDVAARSLLVTDNLKRGGLLLACPDLPKTFSDFVFGLTEGWFARTLDPDYPIGRTATESDWRRLSQEIGVSAAEIQRVDGEFGPFLSLVWASDAKADACKDADAASARPVLRALLSGAHENHANSAVPVSVNCLRLIGTEAEDRATVAAYLDAHPGACVVYDVVAGGGAAHLTNHFFALSAIAKELAARQEPAAAEGGRASALAVLLPAGAPIAQPGGSIIPQAIAAHSALWSFLRVVRNEYPDLEIHSIDTGVRFSGDQDPMHLAESVLDAPSTNREWTLDPDSGALCELRVVPGPSPRPQGLTRDYAAATMRQGSEQQIAGLKWEETNLPEPGLGEVVIQVEATALNYRDVMWAMGLLPEEALAEGFAGVSIGMECSGRIFATGPGVTGLETGDAVMAVAGDAFATHVVAAQEGVVRLPDDKPTIDGATLPVAFLTAYYALVELGRLQAGESVLIHGGAGGVGLAALQIAKLRGATVIATAGTPEKRDLLSMLGADHVLDSRSMEFAAETMRITGGEGVDVLLNSLFGDVMERSLSLLKPFGRFLELGKRDYFADTKLGLRPFRRNISYFGIDADQLLKFRPKVTARLFEELSSLFSQGFLNAIPYRVFAYDEVREAFRLMQGSGHVGKILVTPPRPGVDLVARARPSRLSLPSDGFFLVAGGVGGFGLAAADWLVGNGARFVALCSRRGVADDETQAALARWTASGVHAEIHACDVRDETAVEALLANLRATAPLRGVVHAAMVLDDALLVNLDYDRVSSVLDVKAKGAEILDRLTRNDPIEHFILFSSVTTMIGNPGQANYVAANGFLEGLARARRAEGLPALAAGFGAISDVGYLAGDEATKAMLGKRVGNAAMTAREALDRLSECILADPGTPEGAAVTITEMNWQLAGVLATVSSPLFEVVRRRSFLQTTVLEGEEIDLRALVEGKSPKEAEDTIFDLLANEIAATLRIPASEVNRTKMVRELGIDSLMAMELGINFRQKTGVDLPLANLAETATVGDIAQKLLARLATPQDQTKDNGEQELLDRLADAHSSGQQETAVGQ